MVRGTTDLNDKIVKRDICTFNAMNDIRQCTNWDTPMTTKEMKDSTGNWVQVE